MVPLVLPSSCSLNSPGKRNMKFHCRNRETAKLCYASVKLYLAFISGRTGWAEASPSLYTLSPWERGRAGKAPGTARGWFLHSPVQATVGDVTGACSSRSVHSWLSQHKAKPETCPPHIPGAGGCSEPWAAVPGTPEGGTAHTEVSASLLDPCGDEGPKGLTRHPQGMPQAQPLPFLPTTEINEIPTWLHPRYLKIGRGVGEWLAAGVPLPRDSHPPQQAPPPCGLGQDELVLQGEALHV